ncbi:MAG: FAD-dependent thymidylate synthase [Caulobacteraceae bacterium]|nr:FAD-dependent thymidylate synthase [Caulobacteraceae bacterium]
MNTAQIWWSTPDIDKNIAQIARVSNPNNQMNTEFKKLLEYMMKEGHVSPFEMANVCMEINTTRDIARQILRHRSFSFQEFSQRYQTVETLGQLDTSKEPRLQDNKNRQNSIPLDYTNDRDRALALQWEIRLKSFTEQAQQHYQWAISQGIAKEQARALLPEGLTPSRMYMNGTLRSWIFYLKQRLDPSTQKEHRQIAECILKELQKVAPITMMAFFSV